MHYQYFPEEHIALQEEILHHPDLLTILAVQQSKDEHIILAEIAAYCKVVLDGTYMPDEITKLCDILVRKLQERRAIVLISPSAVAS
jgi:hypothetical protein